MAKSNQTTKKTMGKEVNEVEPKYYTAFPSYTETTPKKVKGIVVPIDGRTFYVNLASPVVTEKTQGEKVIYKKKEYNVVEITEQGTKDSKAKPKYYVAYPSYTEAEPKKVKGLILPIDSRTFYINIINPVITEKKQGDRVIYSKMEFNVVEITEQDTKATKITKDKAI